MRKFNANLVSPLLAITGFRFSKAWRCEDGTLKNFVYLYLLNTVSANMKADDLTK